jgi:hypothetical protein
VLSLKRRALVEAARRTRAEAIIFNRGGLRAAVVNNG